MVAVPNNHHTHNQEPLYLVCNMRDGAIVAARNIAARWRRSLAPWISGDASTNRWNEVSGLCIL